MKISHFALALIPLGSFVRHADASATQVGLAAQVSAFSLTEIETAIDVKVLAVKAPKADPKAVAGDISDLEILIKGLGLALAPFPGECRIQARLEAEIADLRARSMRYVVRAADTLQTLQEIALHRLERQVLEASEAARLGKGSREQVVKAIDLLSSQAFDFIDGLDMPTTRVRLQEAIAALIADAHVEMDTYEHVRAFYFELMQVRIESALRALQAHVQAGLVSARDFARLVEAYAAQALLVEDALAIPYDCGS